MAAAGGGGKKAPYRFFSSNLYKRWVYPKKLFDF